ncbi:NPC intracellular cholesterol transporter 1-like [Glandiceps talaboti]
MGAMLWLLKVILLLLWGQQVIASSVHKEGYCVWYGMDDLSEFVRAYNGPAKELKEEQGVQLLAHLCPEIANSTDELSSDHRYPLTCCDFGQLKLLQGKLGEMQTLANCPACYYNFRRQACSVMCHPSQSLFANVVDVERRDSSGPQPVSDPATSSNIVLPEVKAKTTTALYVNKIDFFLQNKSANTLYASCKDVKMLSSDMTVFEMFCEMASIKQCTLKQVLDNFWSSNYSHIFANFTQVEESPFGGIKPLDIANIPCNDTLQCSHKCLCTDCPASCTHPSYIVEEALILALNASWTVYSPYPFGYLIPFGPVLSKDILHQVLDIQELIMTEDNSSQSYNKLCLRINGKCVTHSVLNYYQNSRENFDKVVYDRSGFWMVADYHDHFMSCVRDPNQHDDHTALNMSCLGDFGGPIQPWKVLRGYNDKSYTNSTALVMSFLMKTPNTSDEEKKLRLWENEFREILQNISSPDNLTFIVTTHIAAGKDGHLLDPMVTNSCSASLVNTEDKPPLVNVDKSVKDHDSNIHHMKVKAEKDKGIDKGIEVNEVMKMDDKKD